METSAFINMALLLLLLLQPVCKLMLHPLPLKRRKGHEAASPRLLQPLLLQSCVCLPACQQLPGMLSCPKHLT